MKYFFLLMLFLTAIKIHSQSGNWEEISNRFTREIEYYSGNLYSIVEDSTLHGITISTNNGNTWNTLFEFTTDIWFNLLVIDKNGIFYGGSDYNNKVFRSIDGGENWEATSLHIKAFVLEVDSNNTLWASDIYKLYKSTDSGTTWDSLNFNAYSLNFNSNYGVMCLFSSREIYLTSDGGSTWDNIFPNEQFRDVIIDDENNIYTIGTSTSKVYKSADLGLSWNILYNNTLGYQITKYDTSLFILSGYPYGTINIYKGSENGQNLESLGSFFQVYKIFINDPFIFVAFRDGLFRRNINNIAGGTQNYFPTKASDRYQLHHMYQNWYPPFDWNEYYTASIATDTSFQNKTYVWIWDHYYRMDTTLNKLFILNGSIERLAFDFNKTAGETDILYIDGYAKTWTYSGVQNGTILGEGRMVREITHYGFFFNGVDTTVDFTIKYSFADNIGIYQYKYNNYLGGSSTRSKKVISAIINNTIYNPIILEILPTFPDTISRNISNFDMFVDITASYIGLVDSLNADLVAYQSDELIYQNTYYGSVDLKKISISIPEQILSQTDSIGIRVYCNDQSIFNNNIYYPVTGYHFIPVVDVLGWNLIIPQIFGTHNQAMEFFTPNVGLIYTSREVFYGDPPTGISNVTQDGGITFNFNQLNWTYGFIKEITALNQNIGYMLLGSLRKTTDQGSSWIDILNHPDNPITIAMSFLNVDTGWVSARIPKIYRTYDGGLNWVDFNTSLQERFNLIDFVLVNDGYAVTQSGKIYRSSDGGETWQYTNSTIINQKKLKMFQNGYGWLIGNGIWRTEDGGFLWVQQFAGSFVDAYFFDKNTGWVIGSSNGSKVVLYTNNGGANWAEIEVPEVGSNYLYVDFVDESHGWIYSENKRLLKTTNGGATFIKGDPSKLMPNNYLLSQNYPNPFNPSTKIQYSVNSNQKVRLKVYDLMGREIATLVNEEKPAGEYEVEFKADGLPSGIYFYQLRVGNYFETKKMVLLR